MSNNSMSGHPYRTERSNRGIVYEAIVNKDGQVLEVSFRPNVVLNEDPYVAPLGADTFFVLFTADDMVEAARKATNVALDMKDRQALK